MAYFDVFVAPVADAGRTNFEAFVQKSHTQLLSYGATEVVDLWGDDVPEGQVTSLPLAVQLKEGESVSVGYVIWPSKEVRDAGWAKIMEESDPEMPFDGKRMIYGGFSELLVSRS